MGRPAHKPTDESRAFVERLIANGVTRAVIARVVGITEKTLEKHYHHELSTGAEVANEKVAASLYAKAIDPKGGMSGTVAAIFWAKTRMRWVETQRIENTGPDGAPLPDKPAVQIILPHNGRGTELAAKLGLLRAAPPLQIEAESEKVDQPPSAR